MEGEESYRLRPRLGELILLLLLGVGVFVALESRRIVNVNLKLPVLQECSQAIVGEATLAVELNAARGLEGDGLGRADALLEFLGNLRR